MDSKKNEKKIFFSAIWQMDFIALRKPETEIVDLVIRGKFFHVVPCKTNYWEKFKNE